MTSSGSALASAGDDIGNTAAADVGAGDSAAAADEPVSDSGPACGGQSFTAGTLVLLASGKSIPISKLQPGDKGSRRSQLPARTSQKPSPPSWSTTTPTCTTSP